MVEDILWILLAPPAITAVWYALSRSYSSALGTSGSTGPRRWRRFGTWIILITLYAIFIGFFGYARLIQQP